MAGRLLAERWPTSSGSGRTVSTTPERPSVIWPTVSSTAFLTSLSPFETSVSSAGRTSVDDASSDGASGAAGARSVGRRSRRSVVSGFFTPRLSTMKGWLLSARGSGRRPRPRRGRPRPRPGTCRGPRARGGRPRSSSHSALASRSISPRARAAAASSSCASGGAVRARSCSSVMPLAVNSRTETIVCGVAGLLEGGHQQARALLGLLGEVLERARHLRSGGQRAGRPAGPRPRRGGRWPARAGPGPCRRCSPRGRPRPARGRA